MAPRGPLTRREAEEVVTAWLVDHLTTDDAGADLVADEVADWLVWHESDIAWVVEVRTPAPVVNRLAAATVEMPRLDVPEEDDGGVTTAPVDPSELRVVVDRRTARVAAAGSGEPVSHLVELWRRIKALGDEDLRAS